MIEIMNELNGRCIKCDMCDNLTVMSVGETDICLECLKSLSEEVSEKKEYLESKHKRINKV
jgi:hypothetical protein